MLPRSCVFVIIIITICDSTTNYSCDRLTALPVMFRKFGFFSLSLILSSRIECGANEHRIRILCRRCCCRRHCTFVFTNGINILITQWIEQCEQWSVCIQAVEQCIRVKQVFSSINAWKYANIITYKNDFYFIIFSVVVFLSNTFLFVSLALRPRPPFLLAHRLLFMHVHLSSVFHHPMNLFTLWLIRR